MNSSLLFIMSASMPYTVDASHATPITRVNQSPKLLKLIGWRHCPCFRWVPCIPGTTVQMPDTEPCPTVR